MNVGEDPAVRAAADVYAADTQEFGTPESSCRSLFSLSIEAISEPGVFSQIANLINLANVAPERARIEKTHQGMLEFYIEVADVRLAIIESICRKAAQLTAVVSVAYKEVH